MKKTTIERITVPLQTADDFCIIVRQKVDRNGNPTDYELQCEGAPNEEFTLFEGYQYDSVDDAAAKAIMYLKKRAQRGDLYRYLIMKPIAIVEPEISNQ